MKLYKSILVIFLVSVVSIIVINVILMLPAPFGIKVAQDNDWIGFWGNIIGALIGGIVTFLGISVTIKFEREKEQENRRLQVLPFLKFTYEENKYIKENSSYLILSNVDNESPKHSFNGVFILENLGINSAIDLKVFDIFIDNQSMNVSLLTDILEVKRKEVINLLVELPCKTLDGVTEDNLHTYVGSAKVLMKVGFCDLLENYYEQSISLSYSYGLEFKQNDIEHSCKYSIHSNLSNVSRVKLIKR